MKKTKLRQIQEMVMFELRLYPETRDSDRVLSDYLYRDFCGVTADDSFTSVMNRADLPKFESIRRARQKIQAEYEDLRGSKEVEEARFEAQEEYIDYSREEI